jgi:hypothetical protein
VPLEVLIDLNMRTPGNGTVVGFEDVVRPDSGELPPLMLLDTVIAREEESGIRGAATIMSIDPVRELIYLDVDWSSLTDQATEGPAAPPQSAHVTSVTRGLWTTSGADSLYGVGAGALYPLFAESIHVETFLSAPTRRVAPNRHVVTTR